MATAVYEHATGTTYRDPRLDVARGFALVVIFASHMPQNPLWHIAPGRFGFSDSAEIFVFCSGIAAALAFGRTYDMRGWMIGTARVLYRIWQIYWAHIATFFVIVTMNVKFDSWAGTGTRFVDGLNLRSFLESNSGEALVGLLTLGYVPNYFDILPLYMVVLLLVPLAMALAHLKRGGLLVLAMASGLWFAAEANLLELSASPWSSRGWFFNPFSWQLIFFLGFALGRGWLPVPPRDPRLILMAAAFLMLSLPFAWFPLASTIGYPKSFLLGLAQLTDKTHLGALRVAHFMALAYVAFILAGERGCNLSGPISRVLQRLGRETLSVFVAGLMLSVLGGFILYRTNSAAWAVVGVNACGVALLYAVAIVTAWFKSSPWKGRGAPATAAAGDGALTTVGECGGLCSDGEPGAYLRRDDAVAAKQ